ncbi:MAG: 4-(cytidine 5'-diphospho)-2-C-methyl-D-erythritol kinase [Nitrospirae bacterium]|nr:4-(cytidine 5'-diphospho)-2-C-methyl-D-erythritol kinase [Nitrospirota bacterium]
MRITVFAPAKLNLYLKVLGRRPDGFHALDSLFHVIGLADTLTIEERPAGVDFSCSNPALAGPDNLAARAAAIMIREAGGGGVRLHLDKRIPAGAGLGGGSSDAAAVLTGLNRLWRLGLAPERLAALGAELGSDVPFFVYGGCARVTGRGEVIQPLTDPLDGWCVLIHPGCHLDTGRVFRAWAAETGGHVLTEGLPEPIITTADATCRDRAWAELGNDLQGAACRLAPEIGLALDALRKAGGARARMSGSGSAVFCITADHASAAAIGQRLQVPDRWRVWVVPLVCDPALSGEPTAGQACDHWGVDKR